jgi:hypothetical protein
MQHRPQRRVISLTRLILCDRFIDEERVQVSAHFNDLPVQAPTTDPGKFIIVYKTYVSSASFSTFVVLE